MYDEAKQTYEDVEAKWYVAEYRSHQEDKLKEMKDTAEKNLNAAWENLAAVNRQIENA